MSPVPFAHLGHALPMLPFFAPPLVLTLGIVLLTVHDRLRRRRNGEQEEPQERAGLEVPPSRKSLGGAG